MKVVKAMRALAVESGVEQPNWKRWVEATDERKNEPVLDVPVSQENVRTGPTASISRSAARPSCSSTARPPSTGPSAPSTAQVLKAAGVEFGLMREQWCCGGPAAEMGYADARPALRRAQRRRLAGVGAKRIIAIDPHDYISVHRGLPGLLR